MGNCLPTQRLSLNNAESRPTEFSSQEMTNNQISSQPTISNSEHKDFVTHNRIPSVSIASLNEEHQANIEIIDNDTNSNSDTYNQSIVTAQNGNIITNKTDTLIIDVPITMWQCTQCTLLNNMHDLICQLCEYPHHTQQSVENYENEQQHYLSYTSSNLSHEKSWLCSSCFAMNRLIDTMNVYKMKCAICNRATYCPGITEIIMSFEWDHKLHSHNDTDYDEKQPQCISKTRGKIIVPKFVQINCKNWHIFMMGFIREIYKNIICKFEISLCRVILVFGNFYSDGWDNYRIMKYQKNNLIIDKYLTYLRRTNKDKGIFKNAFGTRYVHYPGTYKWWLKIDKIRNKGIHTDTFAGNIVIGVMDARGLLPNIGAPFFSYDDAFGWTENGYVVNNGKFKEFGHGFKNQDIVEITLEWDRNNKNCKLLFNGWKGFQLNPNKAYKLAVALKTEAHRLKWIKFSPYDT